MSIKRFVGLGLGGTALALAAGTVSHFEGKRNEAYVDPVGVVTICYGHTSTARIGQTHSDEECDRLLAGDLGAAFDAVDARVTVDLPPTRRAALASFVYNVGAGAFGRSTLLRKLNAGETVAACNELDRWVYAGDPPEILGGLVARRGVERWLCLYDEYATLVAGDS